MKVNEWPQIRLRLPPDLDLFIEGEAARNFRTKNSEIVYRLGLTRAEASGGAQIGVSDPVAGEHRNSVDALSD
ncbi:hypothetical protein [Zavarzinia aquatilis]|uniref:Arc-like DNA binding domain-containing protein n=1 Tax=Zavarzinia aquatilis TaxID=2211142 RepID=A0A317EBY6_9PROT|nr:hypothetical protein [Zavarzinia aquatilis]PWR24577.1 hypothetical protein DKG74_07165 [Zavarzinia aquatilis]